MTIKYIILFMNTNINPQKYFNAEGFEPAFATETELWQKNFTDCSNNLKKQSKMVYYKIGKNFGLFIKRFLTVLNCNLYYYQNQQLNLIKGKCNLHNLYYGQFTTSTKLPFYSILTNYKNRIEFHFRNQQEINNFYLRISKYTIKLKFYESYNLQYKIGQGSFSQVYLGHKKLTLQKFAIKIISKTNKYGDPTKLQVQKQKYSLIKLDSQYISKLYQTFQDQSYYYFVLNYEKGTDLLSFIKLNKKFQLDIQKQILRKILKALFFIHKNGAIHRDIKPQNIMINKSIFQIKIIDLGLCLFLQNQKQNKKFKRCGTLGYTAPQILNISHQKQVSYNQKCDVFSFGIVAYMLLLGQNPIKGKTHQETAYRNKNCIIDINQKLILKKYGQSCFNFLMSMLESNPLKRLSIQQALNHNFLRNSEYEIQQVNLRNSHTIEIIELDFEDETKNEIIE